MDTYLGNLRPRTLTDEDGMRARHTDYLMRQQAKLAVAFTMNLHTLYLRSNASSLLRRSVTVADQKSHHERVVLHVHIVNLVKIKSTVTASQRSAESNHWPTPAHVVHALSRSLHSLALVFVVCAGVLIEHNFDGPTQWTSSPGILAGVCRRERLRCADLNDVVHVDVLAVPFVLGIAASHPDAYRRPGEPRYLLIGQEHDDAAQVRSGWTLSELSIRPAEELMRWTICLLTFWRAVSDVLAAVAQPGGFVQTTRTDDVGTVVAVVVVFFF